MSTSCNVDILIHLRKINPSQRLINLSVSLKSIWKAVYWSVHIESTISKINIIISIAPTATKTQLLIIIVLLYCYAIPGLFFYYPCFPTLNLVQSHTHRTQQDAGSRLRKFFSTSSTVQSEKALGAGLGAVNARSLLLRQKVECGEAVRGNEKSTWWLVKMNSSCDQAKGRETNFTATLRNLFIGRCKIISKWHSTEQHTQILCVQ